MNTKHIDIDTENEPVEPARPVYNGRIVKDANNGIIVIHCWDCDVTGDVLFSSRRPGSGAGGDTFE